MRVVPKESSEGSILTQNGWIYKICILQKGTCFSKYVFRSSCLQSQMIQVVSQQPSQWHQWLPQGCSHDWHHASAFRLSQKSEPTLQIWKENRKRKSCTNFKKVLKITPKLSYNGFSKPDTLQLARSIREYAGSQKYRNISFTNGIQLSNSSSNKVARIINWILKLSCPCDCYPSLTLKQHNS